VAAHEPSRTINDAASVHPLEMLRTYEHVAAAHFDHRFGGLGDIAWRSGRQAVVPTIQKSLFKTLKYRPAYPVHPFADIATRSDLGAFTNTSAKVELSIALTLSRK
jgi:hypothetical protein